MTDSDCEIALATVEDIPGILALQTVNLRSNGGALSIEFSKDWFERVLSEMPIIVARRNGFIVGYLVSSPLFVAANEPLIERARTNARIDLVRIMMFRIRAVRC